MRKASVSPTARVALIAVLAMAVIAATAFVLVTNHPAPLQAATSAIVLRTAVLRSRRMFRRKRAGLRTLK